jgi:hypothetical protein
MCVDCVLASPRITQADPSRRTPPLGGSITLGISVLKLGGVGQTDAVGIYGSAAGLGGAGGGEGGADGWVPHVSARGKRR